MIPVHEVMEKTKQKAKDTQSQVQQEKTLQAVKAMVQGQVQVLSLLNGQQAELKGLQQDVARLGRARSKGSFPWGLLLLASGAYALYRLNPAVRQQVSGLLGQADPGVEGNLKRASQAAGDGLTGDQRPGAAVQQVDGELRRAGEKTVDGLKDRLDEVTADVQDAGHRGPK